MFDMYVYFLNFFGSALLDKDFTSQLNSFEVRLNVDRL